MIATSTSYPGRCDILAYRGDRFDRSISVTQDGDPFDFTGYSASFVVRKFRGDTDAALLELSSPSAGVTFSSNTISLSAAAVDMGFDAGKFAYDLELTTGGESWTLLTGAFVLDERVT